jgi:small multidrug resistance pump
VFKESIQVSAWIWLAFAIAAELGGTTALKGSRGLRYKRLAVVAFAQYGASFYFLSLAIQRLPVGVAYAIWSAASVAVIRIIGLIVFKERLSVLRVLGLALTVGGIVLLRIPAGD